MTIKKKKKKIIIRLGCSAQGGLPIKGRCPPLKDICEIPSLSLTSGYNHDPTPLKKKWVSTSNNIKTSTCYFSYTIANVFPTMIRLIRRHLDNSITLHLVTGIM